MIDMQSVSDSVWVPNMPRETESSKNPVTNWEDSHYEPHIERIYEQLQSSNGVLLLSPEDGTYHTCYRTK
jgi:hypothetical protein